MPAYGLASYSRGRVMTKRVREKLLNQNAGTGTAERTSHLVPRPQRRLFAREGASKPAHASRLSRPLVHCVTPPRSVVLGKKCV